VWYPDSAYKTATAIRDFNRGENLPLIIFANWRGFSGGTRDMFAEVLKYGAMIVDALVDYKHPITIYIPPNGELRGGAWVVLDPKINPDQMEMFADVEARGGILEPPAASEIVFKQDKHVIEMMHRLDDKLRQLDADLKGGKDVSKEIKAREKLLLPMYKQVSVTYCDLHDRSGRMKGLGAIREELKWSESRAYLHWRIRRRLQENGAAKKLQEGVGDLPYADAAAVVRSMVADVESGGDRVVAQWIESNSISIAAKVESERQRLTSDRIFKMFSSLPAAARADVVRDLVGYTKVLEASSK
jgi:acetyl-CoA carboxylase/biotin carboxylase 1